jgi:hypothetical protein
MIVYGFAGVDLERLIRCEAARCPVNRNRREAN